LNCGADPTTTNIEGYNALEVCINDRIKQIYIEELLRATAASE
jgi:hypothetical protein